MFSFHQGPVISVDLTRMATDDFDNRQAMINLFSEMKVRFALGVL